MIKTSHLNVELDLYSNVLYLLSWLFLQFVKFLLNFNPLIQCACNSFCIGATGRLNRHIKSIIMVINGNTVIPQGK